MGVARTIRRKPVFCYIRGTKPLDAEVIDITPRLGSKGKGDVSSGR